jgi:FemAB-related protein (PEP-CTERM system-associated)
MEIQLVKDSDKHLWDSYVLSHPESPPYHLIGWKDIIEQTFGHKTFYLFAKSDKGAIIGTLPLVLMKSSLFGSFMVSLPFFNYGGLLADNKDIEKALISEAITIGQKQKAEYIELRHLDDKELNLEVKKAKVSMILTLPKDSETLFKSFESKLRSQIRKPEKEGLYPVIGGIELLDYFYKVFSLNMRELGTPVYHKNFFANTLKKFPDSTRICTVFYRDKPVASGILVSFKGKVEIPWASSIKKYNHLSSNMMLYWNVLKYASDNGFKQFDFGRSTPGEGTYKFKKQWGAKSVQLYWHYWLSNGGPLPEINPHNPKYKYAIKVWQHLPLWLTNSLGPKIVKNIP